MNRIGRRLALPTLLLLFGLALPSLGVAQDSTNSQPAAESDEDTFSQNEIFQKATEFFGETTAGLAKAIEKVFADQGRPNAYITGEEASGAIGIGLRYGEGTLVRRDGAGTKLYWQGPSIGFDFGGNASKVFTLVYHLGPTAEIFQRFPGVDGSAYFIAGFSVNYQKSGHIVLAPIRTGAGLRLGVNVGYLHYTRESSWIPF